MRRGICVALALAGCATPAPEVVLERPCTSAQSSPVEAEPIAPVLTEAQRRAADVAMVTALGPVLGAAVIRFTDMEHPAWGRRQAARVELGRLACG